MAHSDTDFLRWRAALEAIARTGMAFTPNLYDRERYEEVLAIALDMAGGEGVFAEPEEVVIDLRDDNDLSIAARYVTPKVGVSVAITDGEGRLLLNKRAASGLWGLVGGYADVGYSAAEVAVKEAREEVGLDIDVLDLIGVFDGLQETKRPTVQYGLVFLGRHTGGDITLHPLESADAGWFTRDTLPSPLLCDGEGWLEVALSAVEGRLHRPYFDAPRTSVVSRPSSH